MRLVHLEIGKSWSSSYNSSKELVGKAKFAGKDGAVEIRLNPEQTSKILELCAESVVATAKQIGADMVAPLIDIKPEDTEINDD